MIGIDQVSYNLWCDFRAGIKSQIFLNNILFGSEEEKRDALNEHLQEKEGLSWASSIDLFKKDIYKLIVKNS